MMESRKQEENRWERKTWKHLMVETRKQKEKKKKLHIENRRKFPWTAEKVWHTLQTFSEFQWERELENFVGIFMRLLCGIPRKKVHLHHQRNQLPHALSFLSIKAESIFLMNFKYESLSKPIFFFPFNEENLQTF